ncbi:MAG: hypothetical protein E7647_00020 [Ruminococcaceae bacterium]|nr:hypothetical protein [Oscillospiraceae bacterium]
MKKIIPIIIVVAIIIAAIIIVPKYMHTCDDCEKFFMGYAYEPGLLQNAAGELGEMLGIESEDAKKMEKICKDCAEKHHFLTDAEDLDEFRIDPWG